MRRIPRNPLMFESLEWYGDMCALDGRKINDPSAFQSFVDLIMENLTTILGDPSRLQGLADEAMFEHLVVELGRAVLIKKEDAGGLSATKRAHTPDFRVTLEDRQVLLIEVKATAAAPPGPMEVRIPKKEFEGLQRYADIAGGTLKIATFWRCINMWTLVDPSIFLVGGKHAKLTHENAMTKNEMAVLGDRWVGTMPPLTLRVVADPAKPSGIDHRGLGSYTIGEVQLYCQDTLIADKDGKNLAFFMFMFGHWLRDPPQVEQVDGAITSVWWRVHPFHPDGEEEAYTTMSENGGLHIVGPLSSLHARMFRFVSTDVNGNLVRLRVPAIPERLKHLAPKTFPFHESGLRLWVFELRLPKIPPS